MRRGRKGRELLGARIKFPFYFSSLNGFPNQTGEFFSILGARGVERGEEVGVVKQPKEGVGVVDEVERGGGGGRVGGGLEERETDGTIGGDVGVEDGGVEEEGGGGVGIGGGDCDGYLVETIFV